MSPDILTPHHPCGIDSSHDILEIVEFGVQDLEVFGLQDVLFCPMRTTVMSGDDGCEFIVEFSVRNCESIRPVMISIDVQTRWR